SNGATVVKLDVPGTDRLQALQLVGYNDKFIRFQVEDDGPKPEKAKREARPKEPKGPYSYFWEFIHNTGFLTYPAVSKALEARRETEYEDAWEDLLHGLFGVRGGTLAFTSPDDVLAKFPDDKEVARLVERARKFQQEKEEKLCQ